MSIYLNKKIVYASGVGEKDWFALNRWGVPNYTLNIIINGTASVNVEGTLAQINRGEAATADDVFTLPGATGITSTQAVNSADLPLEFVRINQVSGTGTVTLHIMQGGLYAS